MNVIDTFYLLDLDRTLFNTVEATNRVFSLVEKYDADIAALLTKRAELELERGNPFAIREEIEALVGKQRTNDIEQQLLETTSPDQLLLEGALESIAYTSNPPEKSFGILTYGQQKGQQMKLKAAGLLQMPHLITAERAKGTLISSWLQPDGLYKLPDAFELGFAREIVLVDDRLVSFQGLPEQARGYLLSVETPTAAEVSVLPANVMVVRSLHEFIESEQEVDKT